LKEPDGGGHRGRRPGASLTGRRDGRNDPAAGDAANARPREAEVPRTAGVARVL